MNLAAYEGIARDLLSRAGIAVGGDAPWDIEVHDPRFYRRAIAGGAIGLGESYMDGWWDCAALDQALAKILTSGIRAQVKPRPSMALDVIAESAPNLAYIAPGLRPLLARLKAFDRAETHYDAGNDLYETMLDPRMVYSCGYWAEAKTLDAAQEAKLELSCRKLRLEPGMRVLDIGCGWGAFARYAAETRGVSVVGVTISEEQRKLAAERCAGLPIEIRLQDYRDATGQFDRVTSFGMFEHVGRKNYATFLQVAERCLGPDGLLLLETIGDNVSGAACNPWFQKYVFQAPTSMFPSIKEIAEAAEGRFVMEDWHNLGADYAPTLLGWQANLDARRDWVVARYGDKAYRMWRFYLLSCAGAFASRTYQMWQIVFARRGTPGGFPRV